MKRKLIKSLNAKSHYLTAEKCEMSRRIIGKTGEADPLCISNSLTQTNARASAGPQSE